MVFDRTSIWRRKKRDGTIKTRHNKKRVLRMTRLEVEGNTNVNTVLLYRGQRGGAAALHARFGGRVLTLWRHPDKPVTFCMGVQVPPSGLCAAPPAHLNQSRDFKNICQTFNSETFNFDHNKNLKKTNEDVATKREGEGE